MIGKFVVLLVTCTVVAVNANQVQVAVYYESLCPYSQSFYTDQFTPTWRDLKDYINLELVPFGKANSTDYNDPSQSPPSAGQVNFTCQHGPNECLGNKYQSCVLNPEYNYDIDDRINYINCMMRDASRQIPYETTVTGCASNAGGISTQIIKSCAEGVKGIELLLENERKTNLFQQPMAAVPTIVFDNSFSRAESDEAVTSFRAVLCKHINDSPKPKICDNNSGISGASATTLPNLIVS